MKRDLKRANRKKEKKNRIKRKKEEISTRHERVSMPGRQDRTKEFSESGLEEDLGMRGTIKAAWKSRAVHG